MSRKCFQQTPPNTPLMLAFDPDYSVDRTNFIHMYTSKIHQETKHKRNYSICKKIPANTSQYPTVGCIDPYVYIKRPSMNYIIQFTEIFKQTPPNTPLLLAFDPDYSVDKTNSIHMYTSQIYQKTKHKRHYSICKNIPANTSQYPTVGCIDPYVYIKRPSMNYIIQFTEIFKQNTS